MMRIGTIAILSAAVASTGCDSGPSAAEEMADFDGATVVAIERAVEVGRTEVPGAVPVKVKLKVKKDPPEYKIVMANNGIEVDVEIDAETAEILEVVDDGDIDVFDPAAYISLEDALVIARAEVPAGLPVEAEIEIDDGVVEEIEVVIFAKAEGHFVEVELDPVTGDVLEVEIED